MFGTSPLSFSIAASSPGKPGVQEHGHGSSNGWWDVMAGMSPHEHRPIAFTTKGIVVAHPYHPILTLQPFPPMQNERIVDFPVPISVTAHDYGPPKAVAVSSKEDVTFAFFPSLSPLAPGICCIWEGLKLVRHWPLGITGDNVVGCWWLGQERQAVVDSNGQHARLPPLGPRVCTYTQTLLILSESFNVQIVYIPLSSTTREFQGIHVNALHKGTLTSAMPVPSRQLEAYTGHICVRAAIGLGYNDESIILAMQTQLLPPATIPLSDSQNMNLTLPTASTFSPHVWRSNWELSGEEPVIRMCQLSISLKDQVWSFSSNPLPSLPIQSVEHVAHLAFVPATPLKQPGSPTDSIFGHTEEAPMQGLRYLAVGSVSFGNYASNLQTTLAIYSIQPSQPNEWTTNLHTTRTFENRAVTCITQARPSLDQQGLIVALPALGTTDAHVTDELRLLSIPDLVEDKRYQPVHLKGGNSPLSMCIYPTGTHIAATTTNALFGQKKVSIYQYPLNQGEPVAHAIRNAIVKGCLHMQDNTYIYQLMTRFEFPKRLELFHEATEMLFIEEGGGGSCRWDKEVVKELICLLRVSSSIKTVGSKDRKQLEAQIEMCVNVCSLVTIRSALQDYKMQEAPYYGEDSFWFLLSISSWILNKLQQLWRVAADYSRAQQHSPNQPLDRTDINSLLLILVHPLSIDSLLHISTELTELKKWLESGPQVTSQNLKAKDALQDLLCSKADQHSINIPLASNFFSSALKILGGISAQKLRRVWISHELTPPISSALETIISQMLNPDVVDILSLYVQPEDMILEDHTDFLPKITQTLDIITKTVLQTEAQGEDQAVYRISSCSRCGGKSQAIWLPGDVTRWRQWERSWVSMCICGGKWQ